jgi:hypothetical protein
VAAKLAAGRIGRQLALAVQCERDPQGLSDALWREDVQRMPWLASRCAAALPRRQRAVNGWSRYIDDLAAASAALLHEGRSDPAGAELPETALGARDVVLTELRQLVGAVSESPRFAQVRELTMFDIVHRPGQSLHQALSGLPRAVPFGAAQVSGEVDLTLPAYEQHWQRAAHAALALEGYVDSVGRLPDHIAWYVLRDLADLSACLPYLDQDLSERLLPRLQAGEDLGVPYATLTSAGHDALRLVAGDIRNRVPAHERSAASPEPLLNSAPSPAVSSAAP